MFYDKNVIFFFKEQRLYVHVFVFFEKKLSLMQYLASFCIYKEKSNTIMMKRTLLFGSLLAIVISFVACGDDVPQFEFDAEGRCYMPGVRSISHAEFLKYAEGNGWKHVSTYEINEDGSVEKKEHYKDMVGGGPSWYYFEKDTYVTFASYDAYPADFRTTATYDYWEDGNRIGYVNRFDDTFFTQFQVLSVSKDKLEVVEHLGVRDGQDGLKDVYGWATYRKMTAEELDACWEEYSEKSEWKHDASFMFQPVDWVTEEDFLQKVVGYGWQWNYTYEIADDMTYQEKSYYPSQDMAPHYYFEKDTLTRFYQAEDGTFVCSREPYTLMLEDSNPRVVNEATQDTLYLYHISDYESMIFRETLASRDGKPVYGYSMYMRMSEHMLQKFRDKYAIDK